MNVYCFPRLEIPITPTGLREAADFLEQHPELKPDTIYYNVFSERLTITSTSRIQEACDAGARPLAGDRGRADGAGSGSAAPVVATGAVSAVGACAAG